MNVRESEKEREKKKRKRGNNGNSQPKGGGPRRGGNDDGDKTLSIGYFSFDKEYNINKKKKRTKIFIHRLK